MPIRQKVVAVFIALSIFFIILELVRRRKLREEYSWLWLLTGAVLVVLTFWYELLVRITVLIGAVAPTSTLFFFALIFLILVCVQFSIRISKLTNQVKDLVQELALLKAGQRTGEGE
ncbi:MAG TPA: DUF2304 domain-containing protein [Dissulfurispiraceae bacterium]